MKTTRTTITGRRSSPGPQLRSAAYEDPGQATNKRDAVLRRSWEVACLLFPIPTESRQTGLAGASCKTQSAWVGPASSVLRCFLGRWGPPVEGGSDASSSKGGSQGCRKPHPYRASPTREAPRARCAKRRGLSATWPRAQPPARSKDKRRKVTVTMLGMNASMSGYGARESARLAETALAS